MESMDIIIKKLSQIGKLITDLQSKSKSEKPIKIKKQSVSSSESSEDDEEKKPTKKVNPKKSKK